MALTRFSILTRLRSPTSHLAHGPRAPTCPVLPCLWVLVPAVLSHPCAFFQISFPWRISRITKKKFLLFSNFYRNRYLKPSLDITSHCQRRVLLFYSRHMYTSQVDSESPKGLVCITAHWVSGAYLVMGSFVLRRHTSHVSRVHGWPEWKEEEENAVHQASPFWPLAHLPGTCGLSFLALFPSLTSHSVV